MQLKQAKARDGYLWIRQGFWLFKKNPLAFFMLIFLYIFIAQFMILIPVFGVFAVLLLTPALTVGFMTACQMVIRGERVAPSVYLVGLRNIDSHIRKNLLVLGTIYAFLVLILSLIASAFIDFQQLIPMLTEQNTNYSRSERTLFQPRYRHLFIYTYRHADVVCPRTGRLGKNVRRPSIIFKLDCLLDQ